MHLLQLGPGKIDDPGALQDHEEEQKEAAGDLKAEEIHQALNDQG